MTDTFNVTAAYNQNSYTQGETIVVSISGDDVVTANVVTQEQAGPLTLTLQANDGANSVLSVPSVNVAVTTLQATNDSVIIVGVADTSTSPRVWTIANNGLSVSATA